MVIDLRELNHADRHELIKKLSAVRAVMKLGSSEITKTLDRLNACDPDAGEWLASLVESLEKIGVAGKELKKMAK